jgi:ribonuclease HII
MQKNKNLTIYFDEAWRWPLAGPLFIWLICPIKKLSKKELAPFCDSKQISEIKREELFWHIQELQNAWKILAIPSWMTAAEIDKYWMSNALHCAILRGMIQICDKIFPEIEIKNSLPSPVSTKIKTNLKYTDVLNYFSQLNSKWINIKLVMDWNRDFGLRKMFPFWKIETIISWDAKVKEIWMASIIAKVSRDRVMKQLPKKYRKYNFDKHKWYWTKEHKKLIEKYGPSDIHRKLFLKWIFPNHKFSKKLPEKF